MEHDDCPWERRRGSAAQPPVEVRVTPGDAFRVVDLCPRCRGTTVKDFRFVPPQGAPPQHAKLPSVDGGLMQCDCGEPHDGRPATERRQGCGHSWLLRSP